MATNYLDLLRQQLGAQELQDRSVPIPTGLDNRGFADWVYQNTKSGSLGRWGDSVDGGPVKGSGYLGIPGMEMYLPDAQSWRDYGFGGGSPDPKLDMQEFMKKNNIGSLAEFQQRYNALPLQFDPNNPNYATFDPNARVNKFSYEPNDPLFLKALPIGIAALGAAGLGGMLPGTESVFAGLGAGGLSPEALAAIQAADPTAIGALGTETMLSGAGVGAGAGAGAAGVNFANSYLPTLTSSLESPFTALATQPSAMELAGLTPGLGIEAQVGSGLMNSGVTDLGFLGGATPTFDLGGLGQFTLDSAGNIVPSVSNFAGGSIPGAAAVGGGVLGSAAANAAGSAAGQIAKSGGQETGAQAASRILKDLGVNVAPGTLGLLGTGLATGLGVYGANQQSKAADNLATQFMDLGAPYRAELQNLVQNPGSFYSNPVVTNALQQGSDAMARSLSAKVGNPILNPTALQEMQNYTSRGLLDQYNNQFRNLAAAGGLGVSQAAPLGSQAVSSQGNVYNGIGAGLQSLFGNQRDYAGELIDIMREAQKRGQPIGQSYLNTGY